MLSVPAKLHSNYEGGTYFGGKYDGGNNHLIPYYTITYLS